MRQRDHFGLVCGARGEQDKGVVIGEIVTAPLTCRSRPGPISRVAVAIPPAPTATRTSHVRNGEPRRWRGVDPAWADEDPRAPSLSSRAASSTGQCGIQRSDHEPGACRPRSATTNSASLALIRPTASPLRRPVRRRRRRRRRSRPRGRHRTRDPIPREDKRRAFRMLADLPIEDIDQSCDRRRHMHVRAANDSLNDIFHAHRLLAATSCSRLL